MIVNEVMKPIAKLIIALAIPVAIGAIAGSFTATSVNGWFTSLIKPDFNPPNWLFAPVWTTLYIMMGFSSFMVWNSKKKGKQKNKALGIYMIQLLFNFLWSFIFFYAQEPGWALVDIILMWMLILITILQFGKISSTAAWLLVPYICWVSFAAILNFAIWKLN